MDFSQVPPDAAVIGDPLAADHGGEKYDAQAEKEDHGFLIHDSSPSL